MTKIMGFPDSDNLLPPAPPKKIQGCNEEVVMPSYELQNVEWNII